MVYAVGPAAEGDRKTQMSAGPAWFRFGLAAVAMLAVGFGSGVIAIWLVLAPIIPTGAAGAQMRQLLPSQVGQTSPSEHGAESTAVVMGQSYLAPPAIEQSGLVSQGVEGTGAVVTKRRVGCRE